MCFSSSGQSKFHFGARAGNNLANMTMEDIKDISGVTTSLNKTFHFGGIVEYDISSLSDIFCLESGLFLSWKGTEITYRDDAGMTVVTITPIYLEVPFNALYNVNFGASELQFFVGPYLGYIVAGKIKTGDKSEPLHGLKPFDFGLNMGAGIKMDNILVRLQYGYGLRNLDPGGSSSNEMKNRVISISIGCMFGENGL